jgi:hypothetical protein
MTESNNHPLTDNQNEQTLNFMRNEIASLKFQLKRQGNWRAKRRSVPRPCACPCWPFAPPLFHQQQTHGHDAHAANETENAFLSLAMSKGGRPESAGENRHGTGGESPLRGRSSDPFRPRAMRRRPTIVKWCQAIIIKY